MNYSNQQRERKLKAKQQQQTGGGFAAQAKRAEMNQNYTRVPLDTIKAKIHVK